MESKKHQDNFRQRISLLNPVHFCAVGFGFGMLSPAPGTWGTLIGWLLGILFISIFGQNALFLLAVIAFIVGCFLCGKTARDMQVHDHGAIVWDEIAAIWLVLSLLPQITLWGYLAAFFFFRLFDIVKPYPIKVCDKKLESGFGIMIDDTLAALFSLLSIYSLHFLLS